MILANRLFPLLVVSLVDMEPALDGVFRAVRNGICSQPGGIFSSKHGRWVVTLNLAGELYQAFFDTQVCTWVAG